MPNPRKNESKQDYLKRCTASLIESEGKSTDQAYAVCNAYWDEAQSTAKAERTPITLSGSVTLELAAGPDGQQPSQDDTPTGFMMTAYTGEVLDLGTWGRYVFDVSGMQAKAKIPILREHQRDRVVGWSRMAWHDGRNFMISGQFSKRTDDALDVLELALEGFPWQCSVGIVPRKVKRLGKDEALELNGRTVSGPVEVWLESHIGEVSFVSLGADSETAAIALADQHKLITCDLLTNKEDETMNLAELQEKHPDLYQEIFELGAASVDLNAVLAEGAAMERARVAEILAAEGDPEVTQRAIAEGINAEGAYKLFFEAEKARKIAGLKEMAESAPLSPGYQEPREPERIDDVNVELSISNKALELMKRDKIDLAEATRRVLSDNKELAERYYSQFNA